MTRMDCSEIRELLHAFLDDEMPAEEHSAVAQHLDGCPTCSGERAKLTALRDRIRSAGTHAVPADLEAEITARLRGAVTAPGRWPWTRRAVAIAATHVIAAALGALLYSYLAMRGSDQDLILRDGVSAHIRSLLADQLLHVASNDQHTVRPWFVGRVPFAPPVRDLSAREFPLLGGRSDYLGGRPVAVVVYGRRKHRINVFIQPSGAVPGLSAINSVRNGYNALGWRRAGFDYLAVSDLNAEELGQLAALLRDRD